MSATPLDILALEPWLGGSHERTLTTWCARSRHVVSVRGLAPRHWRWRMEASAWSLGAKVRDERMPKPDVLFVSDYVDLPRLRGFLPPDWADVPALLYMHENQLTYPRGPQVEPQAHDASYGFTNALSCVAADAVVFNSRFHADAFRTACANLLASLPRPKPAREVDAALAAAHVIGPGIELEALPLGPGPPTNSPLRVAFNHRWEHDKDPLAFLCAVREALSLGASVELVLLGEGFEEQPAGIAAELAALEPAIVHSGFARSRAEYARLLGSCDLVVSTAQHEFYGIAVLEGLAVGCTPLVPNRLAYPEVLPREAHGSFLFEDAELPVRLARAATRTVQLREPEARRRARAMAERHDAVHSARALDALCAILAGVTGSSFEDPQNSSTRV